MKFSHQVGLAGILTTGRFVRWTTITPVARLVITVLLLGILNNCMSSENQAESKPPPLPAPESPAQPDIARQKLLEFQLTDQHNQPFGLPQLAQKWTFLFFGYTKCPDVCPMTTLEMNRVFKKLQQHVDYVKDTQFVFVSLDPFRDDQAALQNFLEYYNKDFVGVIGTLENLDKFARQLNIEYRHLFAVDQKTGERQLLVEHGTDIILVAPDAAVITRFSMPHNADNITHQYLDIRKHQ